MKIKSILAKAFKRSNHSKLSWGGVLLLGVVFVMFAFPAQYTSATNTAGFTYLHNPDGGWLSDLSTGLVYEITGPPQSVIAESDTQNPDGGYNYRPGAIQAIGTYTSMMYTSPPASLEYWSNDTYETIAQNLDISVSAQDVTNPENSSVYYPGLGTQLLRPMLGFWQWSRNIVYGFMIILFIFLAFLILFRQPLGGSGVVTLFNSIPNILAIIAAVTFSYPVIGLSVDLIFVGSNIVQSIMFTAPGAPGQELVNASLGCDDAGNCGGENGENIIFKQPGRTNPDIYYLQPDDPSVSIWTIWGASGADFCDDNAADPEDCQLSGLIPKFSEDDQSLLTNIGNVISRAIGAAADQVVEEDGVGGFVGNNLIQLILAVTALTASFKLFMGLLNPYVTLLLAPVYVPFMLGAGIVSGKAGSSILNVLKLLLSSSLIFIALYAVFLFMIMFGHSSELAGPFQDASNIRWTPPLLGYSPQQQIFSGTESIIRSLVVYVIFVASPQIPTAIKNMFNVQSGGAGVLTQVGQSTSSSAKTLAGAFQGARKLLPG